MTQNQLNLLRSLEAAMRRDGFNTFYALVANDRYGRPAAAIGVDTIEDAVQYVERANRASPRPGIDFETGVTLVLKGFKGEPGKPETWTEYREHRAPRI